MAQATPLLVLVGRPNVGKSTVFNRLVGRRRALVLDQPGVTRDCLHGLCDLGIGEPVALVDTAGFDPHATAGLTALAKVHTEQAIGAATLLLHVVDAAVGLLPADVEVANWLRRWGKPTLVLANKVDVDQHDERVHELYALGNSRVFPLSAEHNRGFDLLRETLIQETESPQPQPQPVAEAALDSGLRVAVVGRPNVGKSSLLNALLGEERHLAADSPGTTMDTVDSLVHNGGNSFVFVDTAGIRRRRAIDQRLEQIAVSAAFDAIDRAEVAILVLDGTMPPADQDARIAAKVHDKGKGLILAVNKCDQELHPIWRQRLADGERHALTFAAYAPVVRLSARTGQGMGRLFTALTTVQAARTTRVGTGELNRFFREVVGQHPPPVRSGRRPTLFYVSQPLICPPTFVFASRRADDLQTSYVRYLENCLRQRYGFSGTPIWLKFRESPSH